MDDIIELSPRWDRLVQEHIPVEAHLTDIGFRIAMHYFVGHSELPKYRIKVIHSRVLDEPLPDLKTPEDLHVLDFATHTELATYKHLIGKAENLQELCFGYSSLTGQPISEVDVNLPKLTLLYMADRAVEGKTTDITQQEILPKNITGFLGKTFPSIQRLVVCTVATRKQTVAYVKALLKFIQNHSETLNRVKFTVSTSIQNVNPNERENDLVEFSSSDEIFNLSQLANVKLVELEINIGKNFFCGLDQWQELLKTQNMLEHFTFGLEKPLTPQLFEAPVTHSATFLVTIQIGVEVYTADQRKPLDCAIFEGCVNLKMMVLNGPPMVDARTPAVEILNFNKLPKGLVALGLENIYLETKQIAELAEDAMMIERTLEKLSLQNVGTTTGYGVTLAMLDCWITSKVIQEIIVKGINGDENRIQDYEHLCKFGVKSPIAKCMMHAYYYSNFMEYKKPAEFC